MSLLNYKNFLLAEAVLCLICYVFFNRGLALDGSHNLLRMILNNSFYFLELSRSSFSVIQQWPALLLIKYSNFDSVSLLTKVFSFGLIWTHIFSFLGCWLVLPRNKKYFLFFPLFAFLTGPLTGLGLSVSTSLSVFSYIWLSAFIIYYMSLSSKFNKTVFILSFLPLFLSHEMMSYMAWPLIYLCSLKLRNENNRANKLLIQAVILFLVLISISSIFFILFPMLSELPNRSSFFKSLFYMEFFFKIKEGHIEWIYSPCWISFFLLLLPFKLFLKTKGQQVLFLFLCLFGIGLFGLTSAILPFYELFGLFKLTNEETARVWPACVSLPLSLLIWWLFENNKLKLEKSFFLACAFSVICLTVWRIGSDHQFYQQSKLLSKNLSKCAGLLDWSELAQNIHPFYSTAYSLLVQNRKDISAILSPNKKQYSKIHHCYKANKNCPIKEHTQCYYENTHNKMCQYFNLESIDQSRFFNLKPLMSFISNSKSYCEK